MEVKMAIKDMLRELRKRSPYPEMKTFAGQAGISYNALKKIEQGTRLPERETLDKMLHASGAPDSKRAEILKDWSAVMLERHRMSIDIPAVARLAAQEFEQLLEDHEWNLPTDWKELVIRRLEEKLEAELS
jgi:transcriptional regulator with XRE-family HTH domain